MPLPDDERVEGAVAPASELSADDVAMIEALSGFVEDVLAVTHTPGLNLALARGGRVIWEGGFGLADIASKRPMTFDSVTRGGSLSKLYTATSVLQLVEQGVFGLYDPIDRLLPRLGISNPLGERPVTVYDLLTFRSGLATDMTDCRLSPPEPLDEYLADSFARTHLSAYGGEVPRWTDKVGHRLNYSNLSFAALGHLVERLNPAGLSFSDYVHAAILEPLGMTSTALPPSPDRRWVPAEMLDRISAGYAVFGPIRIRTPQLFCAPYPACGLLTTPGDHLRILLAFGNEGSGEGSGLLRPETVRSMLCRHAAITEADMPSDWWTGLGVLLVNGDARDRYFGWSGCQPWGWWNDSRLYPELDLAVAVTTNGWEMLSWHNPGVATASRLVCDFAASWILKREQVCAQEQTWAWKVSYVVGALLAERSHGLLGLSREELPAALSIDETDGGEHWNPAGYQAGVTDTLGADLTLVTTDRFGTAGSLLGPTQETLVWRALEATGTVPMPLSFWAN